MCHPPTYSHRHIQKYLDSTLGFLPLGDCSIAIFSVSLDSFATITFYVASQKAFIAVHVK
jgi:hypothetical protein